MTRLYVIRHCEAFGNINRIFQGQSDGPISENGVKQLEKLSERFSDIHLDHIYASPLTRTQLTAQAINHNGLPIVLEEDFKEICGGVWENKPFASFPVDFPEDAYAWNKTPHLFHPKDGEAMTNVYNRVYKAFCRIAKAYDGQTVAIVSHGCAIRNLLCNLKGLPIESLNEVHWCDNTGVLAVESDGQNHHILYENDNSHLGDLSTLKKQAWWRKENREALTFE